MKKYLINQAKKSMSLFLAVLMLLSCWVWVAPEDVKKAEAADITPKTQYTVRVGWNITVRDATGGHLHYKTVSNRGWGTESGEQIAISSMPANLKTKGQHFYEFTTDDFPTNIKLGMTNGKNGTVNDGRTDVEYIQINGVTVYHGGEGFTGSTEANIYPTYDDGGNFGTTGRTNDSGVNGTFTWPKPMIAGFRNTQATEKTPEININLNKVGGANVEGSSSFDITKYECYDQYGVAIPDAAAYLNAGKIANITSTTTYVSDSNNSDDPSEYATDIWAKGDTLDTVVVSPNLQINNPQGSTGKDSFYLVRKYVVENVPGSTIESKVSAKVNVTYPKYAVNFNSGLSQAKIPYNGDGSPATGTYSPSAYNGGTIAVPDNKATNAPGYTFLGYWSKQQPASGNASYNAAANVFANPCTTEDYNAYKAMPGATEKDGIVTVTVDGVEGRYYDAGVAMDPSTVKTIDVSENYANFTENWYGWWIAKDLTVKFYDVDGTFLGEHLVKAGQKYNAITWPTSKYVSTGYTSGAFKYTVDENIWVDTDGTQINKTDAGTFGKDIMILTPLITRADFDNSYTIKFVHPNNGSSMATGHTGDYTYRQNIETNAEYAYGNLPAVPGKVKDDLQYSYELIGWSDVEPTTGENYHVILEDADFDVNGTAIGANKDWIVRNDANYYAIYRRSTKTYVVQFNYTDATGAEAKRQVKVKYGEDLVAPTDYVPSSYVTKGFGYTFANWIKNEKTYGYKVELPFTSEHFAINKNALDDGEDVTPFDLTAVYGAPVATDYTVTFNYVDENNHEVSSGATVKHEKFILQNTVDGLKPTEEWENEDQLYTYADKWEITEGSATVGIDGEVKTVGAIIDTADLITLTPTSNLTFKAVYANPVPYFTVTYVDGTNTETYRALRDSAMPKWTTKVIVDDKGTPETEDDITKDERYVPADYEGEGGTYVFQGWFDAKEGGNKVDVETAKLTGNITLYSQFKFVPDKFLITFMNHDHSVTLGAREYEKGQNIEVLVTEATKAAQGRVKDDTYEYVFIGWDKAVPTFCEGYDVTFTALYKSVYRYYDVKWYNSKLEDGKWVANGELLTTTKHTFNSKLYTPSVDTVCPEEALDGQNYVFNGWYYNDAEGNAVKFDRNTVINDILDENGNVTVEFYATYKLTAKTYTVTTVVKGEEERTVVAEGTKFSISDPKSGYVDDTYHDAFAGWYYKDENDSEVEFDMNTAITADITLYAKFTKSEHDRSASETVKDSTYYETGVTAKWCSCDREKTEITEPIAKKQDTEAPTGTIYLGGQSWSSTDEQGANATDRDPISIFANANTDVIITSNDAGIGVKLIRAFVFPANTVLTAVNYGAAQDLAIDVYEAPYDIINGDKVYRTDVSTNNANFAIKLGDAVVADLTADGSVQYNEDGSVKSKALTDGESYILYYYVNDKATTDNGAPADTGNQLNKKVRTAKFHYDNTAPVFTVEDENNGKACGVATVTGIEEGAVLTVNGEVVTPTAEGKYVINYAEGMDNVLITATDKAGNTFSKKIKVADHSYLTIEQAASCGVAGYKKVECITCGDVKSNETYAALDHIWSDRQVIPADCVNNGKVVVTCEICGETVTTEFDEENKPVIPANGHDYAKDASGNIIYTTVTASTCTVKGLAEAYCTECKDGRITKELDLDANNHQELETEEKAADCENAGYIKETCDCGYEKITETDPATGHGNLENGTAEWYVTLEPTCYQVGSKELRCTICSNAIKVDGVVVTETVEATGEHVKTVTNPDTYKTDGYVYYKCATEGCPFKYEPKQYVDDSLARYTVIFVVENGDPENEEDVIATITALEGEGIKKDAVTAPDKDATLENTYSFAGWATEDGKETYKLPLTVTEDLVLKATYKASPIYYTNQFKVPVKLAADGSFDTDTAEVYRTLVGKIGDVREASGTPVFAKDEDHTYKFKYWVDVYGDKVTDFRVVAEDRTFYATFDITAIEHEVIFYNGIEYVWNDTVPSGGKVTPFGGETPTKAFDSEYHYTFNGTWLTEDGKVFDFEKTEIRGKTRLYAGYDKIEHTLVETTNHPEYKAATCTAGGVDVKVCSCGYYETTKTNANGHDLVEYTNDKGVVCQKCNNCDYVEEGEAQRHTVKFTDGKAVIKLEKVVAGNKLPADLKIDTPTKDATAQYEYSFPKVVKDTEGNIIETIAWVDQDGKKYATLKDIIDTLTVNADYTFTAQYTDILRYYNVSYLDADNKVLGETISMAYGDILYAYEGANPTKESSELDHFTFTGWDKKAGEYVITSDTVVRPVFKTEKHKWVEIGTTNATCEEAGGTKNQCSVCKFETTANASNKPALGHTDLDANGKKVEHTIVLPTNHTEGEDSYICTRCGNKIATTPDSTTISITVKDKNGELATDGSAIVTITSKNVTTYTQQDGTDLNGVVTFRVPVGHEWIVGITGKNLPQGGYGFELGKGQTDYEATPDKEVEEDDKDDCTCSCHKTSFWGIIYRLFQKFIAIFKGEISCCADPSELYNK